MLRPALIVSAVATVGMVVNVLLQISMAYLFGAQAEFDAYLAAITLPAFVNSVLLASLNYAFIPALVALRVQGQTEAAWLLASNLLNVCCVVLAIVAGLGVTFAEPLLLMTIPGFSEDKLALAVSLARICWPAAIFTAASTLLTAIYQSLGHFGRPAIAPVLGSAVSFVGILLLSSRLGIHAVVLSALLGSAVQAAFLLPILLNSGRYSIGMNLGSPRVSQALLLALPLTLGGLLYRAAPVVERFVASMLPTGSIAHLDYGLKIVSSLLAISMGGLSATIFPALAESAEHADKSRLRATISQGLRTVWALLVPIAAIGIVLRAPVVAVMLQRGNFTGVDTEEVASILPWLLIAMLGMGIGNVIGASFYAMKDTLTPAILGVLEVLIYAGYLPFAARQFGIVGIAAAIAVYWDTGLVVFVVVLWRRLGFGGATIARSLVRSSVAATLAGAVTLGIGAAVAGNGLLAAVLGGGAGVLTYVVAMHLLGASELRPAHEMLLTLVNGPSGRRTGSRRL